ncbi:hypothetical protein [Tsuneonella sp. HG222]
MPITLFFTTSASVSKMMSLVDDDDDVGFLRDLLQFLCPLFPHQIRVTEDLEPTVTSENVGEPLA